MTRGRPMGTVGAPRGGVVAVILDRLSDVYHTWTTLPSRELFKRVAGDAGVPPCCFSDWADGRTWEGE